MSDDIFDDGKIVVTSFCGGIVRPGIRRIKYQVNVGTSYEVYRHKELVTALETLLTTLTGIKSG